MEAVITRTVTYYRVVCDFEGEFYSVFESSLMYGPARDLAEYATSIARDGYTFRPEVQKRSAFDGSREDFEAEYGMGVKLERIDSIKTQIPNQGKRARELDKASIKLGRDKFDQSGNIREYDQAVRKAIQGVWGCSPKSSIINKNYHKPKPKRQTDVGTMIAQYRRQGLSKKQAKRAALGAIRYNSINL